MRRLLSTLTLVFLFALPSLAQGGNAVKAPKITLRDLNGKTVKLSDFKGKVVLINFWAVWCVPCAAEVPELIKWQNEYKDKLQIIGITYPPTNVAKVRRFKKDKKINYPLLLGFTVTKKLFEPSGTLPVTVVIDKYGNIVDRIDGVIFVDEFLSKIKPLLQ